MSISCRLTTYDIFNHLPIQRIPSERHPFGTIIQSLDTTFRLAAEADIERLLEMMAALFANDDYPFRKELTRQNLKIFINDPSLGRLWMIEHEGRTAGYIVLAFGFSFEFKGRDGLIDELFIEEEFRGMGIGSKTLEYVAARAKELGLNALHLEVEKHNEAGMRLYQKFNFIAHKRLFMTKDL
jgi:diamine N-acetyltransferase